MTHAIVLIQAEGTALATLGGELAGIEGVAEAYSVTGEWDFVAILRLREQDQLAAGRDRQALAAAGGAAHPDDGRLRGVLAPRPGGVVLGRSVTLGAGSCSAEMHAGERLRMPLVESRAAWLEQLCADTPGEVAHLGCADSPYTAELIAAGMLLHERLVAVASVTGFDVDAVGAGAAAPADAGRAVRARRRHSAIPSEELGRYALVIAGEVLEHVA